MEQALLDFYRLFIEQREGESNKSYGKRAKRALFPEDCEKYKIQNREHKRMVNFFKQLCKIEYD